MSSCCQAPASKVELPPWSGSPGPPKADLNERLFRKPTDHILRSWLALTSNMIFQNRLHWPFCYHWDSHVRLALQQDHTNNRLQPEQNKNPELPALKILTISRCNGRVLAQHESCITRHAMKLALLCRLSHPCTYHQSCGYSTSFPPHPFYSGGHG